MDTIDKMKIDARTMDQEKWYEKWGDELWATYYEEGADYDYGVTYEDWCEKKYESLLEENPMDSANLL